MNHTEIQNSNFNQRENNESAEVKKIVFKILQNWHWFVLSVLVTGSLAFIYNRYTTPVYEINATVLFEDSYNNVSSPLSSNTCSVGDVFQGLGSVGSMKNIYNQLTLLNSIPLIAKTLEELEFEVSYFSIDKFITLESYESAPFQVIWDKNHPQIIYTDFYLTIHPDGKMVLSADGENVYVYSYQEDKILKTIPEFAFKKELGAGILITSGEFAFTLQLNEMFDPESEIKTYKFRFQTKQSLISQYRGALNVVLLDQSSSVISLTLYDFNKAKGIDFLNKLIQIYKIFEST